MKKLKLLALEPRVLLDAAAAATAVDTHADVADQTADFQKTQQAYLDSSNTDAVDSSDQTASVVAPVVGTEPTEPVTQWSLIDASGAALNQVQTHELIVVDTSIANYQLLLEDVSPDAEKLYIDPTKDGIKQIADAVQGRTDISAIHILSHGKEGTFALGTTILNNDNVSQYKTQLAEIGKSLTKDGDILLYGCNVAYGETGIGFVNRLADLTKADVAASDNATGNTAKGGDWNLEYKSGTIDAQSLSSASFQGLLVDNTLALANNPTAYNPTTNPTGNDYNGDGTADPLRMITWNVIGLDSNKPATSGPDTFMVGVRVQAGSVGYTAADKLVVKISDDDGIDVFGTGLVFADSTTAIASDFDDGHDNIQFINKLAFTNVEIAAGGYKDFYFNVHVDRLSTSYNQLQPFHFEVFKNTDNSVDANGVATWSNVRKDSKGLVIGAGTNLGDEQGIALTKFSWLPDAAAANTPLYLYVEKYISQARNDVRDQTAPTEATADAGYAAIRVDGYMDPTLDGGLGSTASYLYSPVQPLTVFVGSTLDIRVEGQTATQGYPQLTLSTIFNTNIFNINYSRQFYDQPITTTTYQQGLGTGTDANDTFVATTTQYTTDNIVAGKTTANTSIYANPAGWNPATHSAMITSAPPKAGGGPIITDYNVTLMGAGSGRLDTLILDYSGSSFHYNADLDTGIEGIDYVRFNAVYGSIIGNVGVDTNGDSVGDTNLAGKTIQLFKADGVTQATDKNGNPVANVLTDANGNYIFAGLLPATYVVKEVQPVGYGSVTDTDGNATLNQVTVTVDKNSTVATADSLGLGAWTVDGTALGSSLVGYARANFVEGQPDLQLTQTVDTIGPQLGGNVVYTLTVTNTSLVDVATVEVTDKLQTGLTWQADTASGAYNSGTGIWNVGALAAGASKTITITARVDVNTPIGNFAEITLMKDANGVAIGDKDSTVANNSGGDAYGNANDGTSHTPFEDDEAKTTIQASEADLSIVTTISNPNPNVGDTLTFTVSVTNSGPDAATGVKVTDDLTVLDSSINLSTLIVTNAGATLSGGIWTLTDGSTFDTNAGATYGVWNVKNGASLASGSTTTLTFTAAVDRPTTISNYAEITASNQFDPDSSVLSNRTVDDKGDNKADDDEAVATAVPHSADLSLTKSVNNSSPDENGSIIYTLFLSNAGPDDATGVSIVDVLPAGLDVTAVSGGGLADAGADAGTGGNVTWTGISILKGETKIYTITATVKTSTALTTNAQITASSLPDPDSVAGNNFGVVGANDDWADSKADDDETSITITPGATDLSLLKTYVGTLDTYGELVTFTLTVVNSGPKDAFDVRVMDKLPTGLAYNSAVAGGQGTYTSGTGYWDVGTVLKGATASISFKVNANSFFAQTNFAQIVEADKTNLGAYDGISTLNDLDSTPLNNKGVDNTIGTIDDGSRTPLEDDEATVTLPPVPYADLQLTQTVSNPAPGEGGSTTFTLTLTNTGIITATNITVRDYITRWDNNGVDDIRLINSYSVSPGSSASFYQAGTTSAYVPRAAGAGYVVSGTTGGDGDWVIPSLAFGQSVTLSITVTTGTTGGTPFNNDVTNFAQVFAVDQADVDSTKSSNTVTDTTTPAWGAAVQDDEASVTIYNPAGTSRYDVALSQTVVINGGAKTAGSTLVATDTVVYTITANNQANDIVGGAYIFDKWPAGLDLGTVTNSDSGTGGTVTYSTDGGLTFSGTKPLNPTHIRWLVDNFTGTKFTGSTAPTLTLNGTVNAAGATSNNISNPAWFTEMSAKTDTDSSVPNINVFTVANGTAAQNDYNIDDLTDGIKDDDEAVTVIGSSQPTNDLSVVKSISTDGGQTYATTGIIAQGATITYKVSVTNDGAALSNATGVEVKDLLPTGLLSGFQYAYGDGSYASGTGLWTVGNLDKGATKILYIVTQVDWTAAGASFIDNYTQVTKANQLDSDSTVNDNSTTQDDDDKITITKYIPTADLSLSSTVSNPNPSLGDTVTLTLTVTNSGPVTAYDINVKDYLPAGINISSAIVSSPINGTWSHTAGNNYGNWSGIDLASGGIATLTLTTTINSVAEMNNFAEITSVVDTNGGATALADTDSTVNNDSGAFTANEDDETKVIIKPISADLSISKSVSNANPNVNDTPTFKLTIINTGPNDAYNVRIQDYLPTGLNTPVFVSITDLSGGAVAGLSSSYNTATGLWTVNSGTALGNALAVGQGVILTYTAQVNNATAMNSFAQITQSQTNTGVDLYDPDSTVNSVASPNVNSTPTQDDEASISLIPTASDLSLSKSVSNATPNVGDNVTFTLSITNAGPNAATNVVVKDYLSATGMSYVSNNGGATESSGTITWTVGSIAIGETKTLNIVATITADNAINNFAQVTAVDQADPDSAKNNDTGVSGTGRTANEDDEALVSIDAKQIDLKVATAVSKATPNVGETITFTVTVTNEGTDDASGVEIQDLLPAGLSYVANSATQNNVSGGTLADGVAGQLTWSGLSISAGGTKTLTFQATVTSKDLLTNIAQVTKADQTDADSKPSVSVNGVATSNSGTAADDGFPAKLFNNPTTGESGITHTAGWWNDDESGLEINAKQIDLSITNAIVVTNAGTVATDGYYKATITLTVNNATGFDSADNVVVRDVLPPGLTYLSSSTASGTYSNTTGLWSVGTVAANTTKTLTIDVRVNSASDITNYAEITGASLPDVDSNTATSFAVDDLTDGYLPNSNGTTPSTLDDDEAGAVVNVAMIDLSVKQTAQVFNGGTWKDATSPTTAFAVNDPIRYFVTLNNANNFDTANNVVVHDVLPTGITGATYAYEKYNTTTKAWDVTASYGTYNGTDWSGITLASGETVRLIITGAIGSAATDLTKLTNTAEVTAPATASQFDIDSTPNNLTTGGSTAEGEDDWAMVSPNMGVIYGKVLDDANGFVSGTFDAGDSGISGVRLDLYANNGSGGPTGASLQFTTTDSNGNYVFYVPAGVSYVIVETNKNASYKDVASLQSINPTSGAVTIATTDPLYNQKATPVVVAGAEYYSNDFLDVTPWTLSGKVLTDNGSTSGSIDGTDGVLKDVNGTIINVAVNLSKLTGLGADGIYGNDKGTDGIQGTGDDIASDDVWTQISSTTTNATGDYSFTGLSAGRYRVIETNPTGYTDVTDRDGTGTIYAKNTINEIDVAFSKGVAHKTNADFLDTAKPAIDLNGAAAGVNNSVNVSTTTAIAIASSATVADLDDTNMVNLKITFNTTTLKDGANEKLTIAGQDFVLNADLSVTNATGGFDISYVASSGLFTITKNPSGEIAKTDLDTLIQGITYTNSGALTTGNRTFSFVTNDGNDNSNVAVATVGVGAGQNISFALTSTPTISEETAGVTTFTLTLTGGNLTAGNTATVDITRSGSSTDGTDYSAAFLTALDTGLPAGVTRAGNTLTFTSAYNAATPITFTMTATNDNLIDSGETIVGTLSNATINNGAATISTAVATTTINDVDTNTAPTAVNDSATGVSGQPVTITVVGNDTDPENDINPATVKIVGTTNAGDPLVVAGQGTWSVNTTTGAITFTPLTGYTADPTLISYTVKDTGGLESNAVTVTVDYPQTAPTAVLDSQTGTSGQPVVVNVVGNDTDPENDLDPATVKIVGTTNAGDPLVVAGQGTWSVNATTGAITFTPIAGYTADPTPISYTVQDKTGLTSNAATVTVDYPQTAPTAVNDSATGVSGQPVTITVVGNDTDPENDINPATVKIVGTTNAGDPLVVAGQGTWSVNTTTGAITFTPLAGYTADPTPISYTVQDKTGLTSNAATVTVDYPQTAPVAANDTVKAVTGQPVTINVLGNDTDPENDINPATVKIVGTTTAGDPLVIPGQGTWTVNTSTGTITFTPIPGFTADPTPISYTVQDKTGLTSNPATVTVDYPQTAPVAANDTVKAVTGQPVTINVLGNDTDPENDINPATVKIVGTTTAGDPLVIPGQGTWTVNTSTGTITFTPLFSFTGDPTPISYTVQDRTGLTSNPAIVSVDYPDVILLNTSILNGSYVPLSGGAQHIDDKVWNRPLAPFVHWLSLTPVYEIHYLDYWANSRMNPVSLGGALRDQFVTDGVLDYNAGSKFTHSAGEALKFEAGLPNGEPLPDYVKFDQKTGEFKFDAELAKAQGVDSILIRVAAYDSKGNETAASFQTRFNKDATDNALKDVSRPDSERNPLRLVGMLEHQFILQGIGKYGIQGAFEHTNPNEHLTYKATLQDDSPLPSYVKFDADTKSFVFDAEEAHKAQVKKLVIKVTVKDTHNNTAVATFDVDFEKLDDSEKQPAKEEAAPAEVKGNPEQTPENEQIEEEESSQDPATVSLNENYEQNALADLFALFGGSQNEIQWSAYNQDADTSENRTKHSLSEQVKQAGFFGYQQDKGQLLSDLSSLFRKS